MKRLVDVSYRLWKDGLICSILVFGKIDCCVISWSREIWANMCYLGQGKDRLMCVILIYGKMC